MAIILTICSMLTLTLILDLAPFSGLKDLNELVILRCSVLNNTNRSQVTVTNKL